MADSEKTYASPPGLPPKRQQPPLIPVPLPLVLPEHRYSFAVQGWTTLTLSAPDDPRGPALRTSLGALFAAAKLFFDRPEEYKARFATALGSEEGWSCIPGEKEFITVRALDRSPGELRGAAADTWARVGDVLHESLGEAARSLGLAHDALQRFSAPCVKLKPERTATLMRLFRYEGWHDGVVAEPHCDLGLVSFVAGDTPGLEVWTVTDRAFFPIEKYYEDLSSQTTVLAGRQLQRLSNGRYVPGGHLVRSYPRPEAGDGDDKKYRYSVVFALRAHDDVVIDVGSLTSEITGENTMVTHGQTARDLFANIRDSHYNINTGIDARQQQKKRIGKLASKPPSQEPKV
jgi:isopenicillin N synthase-like dioxygenase